MFKVKKVYEKNKNQIQYDYKKGEYGYRKVKARYIEQSEITYKGNPLIEALPPIHTYDQGFDFLSGKHEDNYNYFEETERLRSPEYRKTAVKRLYNRFFPLDNNIMVHEELASVIRSGYVNKDITSNGYIRNLRENASVLRDKCQIEKLKQEVMVTTDDCHSANGFLVLGVSGLGKTTGIKRSLSYYPKIIVHICDDKHKSIFTQIPVVMLECANQESLKGLCQSFFDVVDKIAETKYLETFGKDRYTVPFMITSMVHVAQLHGIGALVIDEIQHLRTKKLGARAYDFFEALANRIHLPIIYIGTYEAVKDIFGNNLRYARKVMGTICIPFDRLENNQDFESFLKTMWNFQWTKKYTPLNEALINAMYEGSVGIPDRIIKLFISSQLEAIESNTESLTPEMISRIGKTNFALTNDLFSAINSNDYLKLSEYDDIINFNRKKLSIDYYKESIIKEAARNSVENRIEEDSERFKEIINELISFGLEFNEDLTECRKLAYSIVKKQPLSTPISMLKSEFAIKILNIKIKDLSKNKKNTES